MDAKADRKNKVLIIHNLHFEPLNILPDQLLKLTMALKAFVLFNQCLDIRFINSNNDEYLNFISNEFSLDGI